MASRQEKDGIEKRGWGGPRQQPPVSPRTALLGSQKEPSEVPTPKRPRGRQRGAKTRVLPGPGLLPRLQGGNHGPGPNNRKRRRKRAPRRSPRGAAGQAAPATCLLTEERFPSGTGRLLAHGPAPSPRPARRRHPPAASPPRYTAYQLPRGSGGLSGERFFFGLGSRSPSPTSTHLPSWTGLVSHSAAL